MTADADHTASDGAEAHRLVLPSSLSIRQAGATRELILAALQESGVVLLDVPDDAEADLSFIQIVEAARRQVVSHGGSVALAHPASGSVLTTLERGGFLHEMTAEDQLFWFHRKEAA
ncbi:hypothetical protein BJF93_16460 [Xaviernesmea oryzae]|uniref:STAS domain-containing protein n=1 Tax=Xaviernesmea oryzae TaxID=464029 RepID=A0A1Q9AT23_9HYPH|nr:STAS domain-containing protein [Xaviernesmea oryzae]OLP58465.1 hypothetical protein BJF93_16460 [Xaviernesmea oryzae]SEM22699.1 hypothetical protein SAMN04487976_12358 [Xaviernesmea oryzae]